MDSNDMLTSVSEIKEDIKDVKEKLHSIDITMTENTSSLKQHMEQTMLLRSMVLPLHEEKVQRDAVEAYKVKTTQTFFQKLKLPALVVSIISVIIGGIGLWLRSK